MSTDRRAIPTPGEGACMRASCAVTIAVVLSAAAPAFASAQSHVQAARKAERRGEWRKALEAWKAAYNAEMNAEYLIGIGDAYAHLGNKVEAKKNYQAYLADPLALPANVERVKVKIAGLDAPAGALALPGLPLPGAEASPPLPGTSPAASASEDRKGKHKAGDAPLTLPGLPLPGATPPATAEKMEQLPLPGLELPGTTPSKKEPEKVATASPPPRLELPGASQPPVKKEQPAVAQTEGSKVAVATTKPPEHKAVPESVVAQRPPPPVRQVESGGSKTLAYIAAGVAVVGLGGGAFFFSQASSAHSDLTGKVHDGATAQSLLDKEKSNKTLSFVGFAGGLAAAGVATALFAF